MRLYGDRRAGPHFNAAPVVIVSYSGGYLSTAYALERGGAAHRIKGVILMDSLYGDEDKFAAWAAARRRSAFAQRLYRIDSRRERHAQGLLGKRRIPTRRRCRQPDTRNHGLRLLRLVELHGDFVTRAWTADPLKAALTMIPGYPRTVRAKRGHERSPAPELLDIFTGRATRRYG